MVVKSKRGRRRYIVIRPRDSGRMTEDALYATLNATLTRAGIRYKLMQFDGLEGIVRVLWTEQERTVQALNGEGSALITVKTSGTLRTLREGVLVGEGGGRRPRTRGPGGP